MPSWRSIVVGITMVVVALGLYTIARSTSVFAIDRIEVRGVSPGVAGRVRAALEPLAGTSLLAFDATDGDRRLAGVPVVQAASYDRDFPHTLVVTVVAERPIALLRRGPMAWVVSDTGRVLRKVSTRPLPDLPRIWLPATADPLVGSSVADEPAVAVRVLSAVNDAGPRLSVRSVRLVGEEVSVTLGSGAVVLLGTASQLPLKVTVAVRVAELSPTARTIDVSVPERAIASDSLPIEQSSES